MALKGRLTSATSKRTLSVQKFSGVPNVIGREIHLHSIIDTRPTSKNGREGWSFNIRIYSLLKATRLMRLRAAPLSIKMWYSLMLAMDGEMISGSYPSLAMLLGQSKAKKLIDVSIHLWCRSGCRYLPAQDFNDALGHNFPGASRT
jgi:hypothetical protein